MRNKLSLLIMCFILHTGATLADAPQPDQPYVSAYDKWVKEMKCFTAVRVEHNPGGPAAPHYSWAIELRPDAVKDSITSQGYYGVVAWLISKNFFEMKKEYNDRSGADIPSTTISVIRDGTVHSTSYRGYRGDDAAEVRMKFWEMEMVIRGVAANIERQKAIRELEEKAITEMQKSTTPETVAP